MPVLNARAFLEESIGSILGQTLTNFELIVVDNGSTDGSQEYTASIQDPRIRLISEARKGAARAINAGIAASRAEILAVMDADDISNKHRLAVQFEYIQSNPGAVLLGTGFSFLIGENVVPVAPPLTEHRQIRRALLDGVSVMCEGSTMFRAGAAKKVGGHSLNGPAHDFDFFLRMTEVGLVHNLRAPLYLYRLHESSSTSMTTSTIAVHKMFAVACAIAREAGGPEPDFTGFLQAWRIRPRQVKLADYARDLSAVLYRNAIIQRGEGKLLSPGLNVFCSALLNPRLAMWRVKRRLGGLFPGSSPLEAQ